jgi:HEAT repeat protein
MRRAYLLRWVVNHPTATAFLLFLLTLSAANAQPPGDPVEAFQQALEQDLDNLPDATETAPVRVAIRKQVLDHRAETLRRLAGEIRSLSAISRTLRLRDSEKLRDKKNKDARLFEIDNRVYARLMDRFVQEFKKAVQTADTARRTALITLAGDLVTNITTDHRGLIGATVLEQLVPELVTLSKSPDPTVQVAVARAVGNIIIQLKEQLTPQVTARIRAIIEELQRDGTKPPQPRRAVMETLGLLIRLFNPEVGEEAIQPKIATREDLLAAMSLTPLIFQGLKDSDRVTRRQAASVLDRLTSLLTKDRQVLLTTPALSQPPAGRRLTDEEKTYIRNNQAALRRELADMRRRMAPIIDEPGVIRQALRERDPLLRLPILRALEDLALLQQFFNERIILLPGDKPEDLATERFFDRLFAEVNGEVLDVLKDPNPQVRLAAAQAVESRAPEMRKDVAALLEGLGDPNIFVRWVLARTLGKIGGKPAPGVVEGLARALCDRDMNVRMTAAASLEVYGKDAEAAVPALLKLAGMADAEVRTVIIDALGVVGRDARSIVPVLARELENPDARVRRSAATAIEKFGPGAALAADALKRALEDDDPEVRRAASEALLNIEKR